jgi:hypothetical protein
MAQEEKPVTGRRMSRATLLSAILMSLSASVAWAQDQNPTDPQSELLEFDPRKPAKNAKRDRSNERAVAAAGATAGCG